MNLFLKEGEWKGFVAYQLMIQHEKRAILDSSLINQLEHCQQHVMAKLQSCIRTMKDHPVLQKFNFTPTQHIEIISRFPHPQHANKHDVHECDLIGRCYGLGVVLDCQTNALHIRIEKHTYKVHWHCYIGLKSLEWIYYLDAYIKNKCVKDTIQWDKDILNKTHEWAEFRQTNCCLNMLYETYEMWQPKHTPEKPRVERGEEEKEVEWVN